MKNFLSFRIVKNAHFKKSIFLLVAFFSAASVFFLSAQEPPSNSNIDYVIREIEFDVTGITRTFVLIANGEFKEGERITGKENLDKYIALKCQLLMNQQVLDSVWIEPFFGESENDGAIPVKLLVHIIDSRNFIVIPYPKYDSNDGFSITLKGRNYNYFGTMSALKVDLGYLQKDSDHAVGLSVESNLPFQAAGLNWNFNFDNFFEYTFNEPIYYQNVSGLSLNLPWNHTTVTFGVNQYLTVNEENTEENIDIYGLADRFYGPYGSSELYVTWRIPLAVEVSDFGEISYIHGFSSKFNYSNELIDDPRKTVNTYSHSLSFGRIDWIGNYREGLSFKVGNSYSWLLDRLDAPFRVTLEGDVTFHSQLLKYIGISSQLKYRQWWHWSVILNDWIPYYNAGDLLRGVLNSDIRADKMLSINIDMPIRALRFWPSEWFDNPKLRFFDFEMHLSPFTDMALLNGPYNKVKNKDDPTELKTRFTLSDMIHTMGIEVIVFPGIFKSLKIRGSIGYNTNKIIRDGLSLKWGFLPIWDEFFIGLDHFF